MLLYYHLLTYLLLYYQTNSDYRMELITDMLRTVARLVSLPDVEFVAHLWDHPKVGWQQPLPVFAHYADDAHRDVPMPAPWSWDHKARLASCTVECTTSRITPHHIAPHVPPP